MHCFLSVCFRIPSWGAMVVIWAWMGWQPTYGVQNQLVGCNSQIDTRILLLWGVPHKINDGCHFSCPLWTLTTALDTAWVQLCKTVWFIHWSTTHFDVTCSIHFLYQITIEITLNAYAWGCLLTCCIELERGQSIPISIVVCVSSARK